MAVIPIRRTTSTRDSSEISALIRVANGAASLANALKTDMATLTTKLNADTGVADTNYAVAASGAVNASDTVAESY
jgi:hypothetical protein